MPLGPALPLDPEACTIKFEWDRLCAVEGLRARNLPSKSCERACVCPRCGGVQGYLAHKKVLTPLGPPQEPRHSPTVVSEGGAVSYARGTPVFFV